MRGDHFSKLGHAANYLIAFSAIVCLNFLLPRLMPGDPLQAIYGDEALLGMTPEFKAELVRRFSLDQPLVRQFGSYLLALVRGDLGHSYYYRAPVLKVVLGALPWTLLLAGLAMVFSTLAGVLLGIESGWRRSRPGDQAMLAAFMCLSGFPDFFMGMLLLLVFGVAWGVLPLAGAVTPYASLAGPALVADVLQHLALPLAALSLVHLSGSYLLTRNTMITTLGESFILTARAKGLSDAVVRYRHAGRNALLPAVTQAGIGAGRVFTGALFVEVVFSYPGVGGLIHTALLARDYPLLQGILLMVAVAVLLANYLVDMAYVKLDPRVNHAH
ncbi:ABC transporter permease [Clostridiales bacterium PH28_bin88]|nr:ABC transporter permease [Clostridiales bacterium PH28_bin88]